MSQDTVTAKQTEQIWKAKPNTETKVLLLFVTFFLGNLGIHRFMTGKPWTGVLYLLTFGLLGFGIIFDMIMIAIDNWDYKTFSIKFGYQPEI